MVAIDVRQLVRLVRVPGLGLRAAPGFTVLAPLVSESTTQAGASVMKKADRSGKFGAPGTNAGRPAKYGRSGEWTGDSVQSFSITDVKAKTA